MKNCFSETKASELVKEINTQSEKLKEVVLNCGYSINPLDSNLESQYLKELDFHFKKLKEFHSSISNMIESVEEEIREAYRTYYRTLLWYKAIIRNPGKRIFTKYDCIDFINGEIPIDKINSYLNRIEKEHLEKYPIRNFCL